jgi:hypothetical protein
MWFEPQMTDLQRPFQVLDSFQYTGGNGGRRDPSDVSFHVRVSQYVLLRWLLSHLSPGGTKVTADKSPLAQHQLSRVPIEVRRKQQLSDMNVKWDVCWPLLMACIILLSRLAIDDSRWRLFSLITIIIIFGWKAERMDFWLPTSSDESCWLHNLAKYTLTCSNTRLDRGRRKGRNWSWWVHSLD